MSLFCVQIQKPKLNGTIRIEGILFIEKIKKRKEGNMESQIIDLHKTHHEIYEYQPDYHDENSENSLWPGKSGNAFFSSTSISR